MALESRGAAGFFSLLVLAFLAAGFDGPVNVYDEGIPVVGAMRVLDGELPYRDFWTIYAPGQFYLLAGLFLTFGPFLVVERIAGVLTMFVLSFLAFLIVRTLTNQRTAFVAWLIVAARLSLSRSELFGTPMLTALPIAMTAVWLLVRHFRTPTRTGLAVAGAAAGLTALFRHDLGAYTLLAGFVALIVDGISVGRWRAGSVTADAGAWPAWRQAGVYAAAGAVALALPAALLLTAVPLGDLISQLVDFPLNVFPRVRSLPAPGLLIASGRIVCYFPHLVALFSAGFVAWKISSRESGTERWIFSSTILLTLVTISFLAQSIVRYDDVHLLPSYIPAACLFAVMASARRSRWLVSAVTVLLAVWVVFLIVSGPVRVIVRLAGDRMAGRGLPHSSVERLAGVRMNAAGEELDRVIGYLGERLPPGGYLYSGSRRHDRVEYNDVLVLFAGAYRSPTKYHELHPGQVTTLPVQEEIAAALDSAHVNYLVLTDFGGPSPGTGGMGEDGAGFLDGYIRDHYSPLHTVGRYSIWERGRPKGESR